MSNIIESQKEDSVIVAFTCVNSKNQIGDCHNYINGIRAELINRGLEKDIEIDSDDDNIFFQLKFSHAYHSQTMDEGDVFYINFVFGTYDSGMQLDVSIVAFAGYLSKERNFVEQLKFCIKDCLIKDWNRIEWLVDKDSELLSVDLYPLVFQTENLIRQMISQLMGRKYGAMWWEAFIPYTIKEKHQSRFLGYKKSVLGFSNIDERLLSIDIGDLLKIITLKVSKWIPKYDGQLNDMLAGLTVWKEQTVQKTLLQQMVVEQDLWEDLFKHYLPNDFKELVGRFDKDRNHIAHNKLIDRQAYSAIKNNTVAVKNAVEEALNKIRSKVLSSEQKDINKRVEEEINEYWNATYESIMESEAGVEIRDSDEILDIFYDSICRIGERVEEDLRFRQDIEIDKESINKLEIIYKINDERMIFDITTDIDPSQGAESTTTISDNEEFKAYLTYTNGEVEYDEEQSYYKPLTEDEFPEIELVVEELVDYINEHFPNFRQRVDQDKYRIIKDGGDSPIIDYIPCDECGEFYIAADDTYAEQGTCLNCGCKHELRTCERCGSFFTDWVHSDDIELCDNCRDYCEKE